MILNPLGLGKGRGRHFSAVKDPWVDALVPLANLAKVVDKKANTEYKKYSIDLFYIQEAQIAKSTQTLQPTQSIG